MKVNWNLLKTKYLENNFLLIFKFQYRSKKKKKLIQDFLN